MFGNDVKSTNIPVEVWRYYLLANRPEVTDCCYKVDNFSSFIMSMRSNCLDLTSYLWGLVIQVSDTLFTWKDLQAKLTGELLNNLGNFVNRVLTFIAKPEPAGWFISFRIKYCVSL